MLLPYLNIFHRSKILKYVQYKKLEEQLIRTQREQNEVLEKKDQKVKEALKMCENKDGKVKPTFKAIHDRLSKGP